jgi:hypothetical protein
MTRIRTKFTAPATKTLVSFTQAASHGKQAVELPSVVSVIIAHR